MSHVHENSDKVEGSEAPAHYTPGEQCKDDVGVTA